MIRQKADRIKHIWITIVFVLCFLLIDLLYQNPVKSDFPSSPIFQTEYLHLKLSLHYAISISDIPQPPIQFCSLPLVDNIYFTLHQEHFKIFTDNRLIEQKLISLHKLALIIKPNALRRFYNHSISQDSEDLPVLS